MFLSRLQLSESATDSRRFWNMMGRSDWAHKEVWRVLSRGPEDTRDFLYRTEQEARPPRILVLSPRPPKDDQGLWTIESKPFEPKLSSSQRLGFALRANPVVRKGHARHDVVMDAKHGLREQGVPKDQWPTLAQLVQIAGGGWLESRGESNGFVVESVVVEGYRVLEVPRGRGKKPMRLATGDFAGILTVLEPERFLESLRKGIGPGKAFGCGLMLVRRA